MLLAEGRVAVPKDQRLRRAKDFSLVMTRGRRWSSKLLVAVVNPNGRDDTRFGFSVSKRVGISVVRNRIKRRLREMVRQMNPRAGSDVVIIARKGAGEADFGRFSECAHSILQRAGILQKDDSSGLSAVPGKNR